MEKQKTTVDEGLREESLETYLVLLALLISRACLRKWLLFNVNGAFISGSSGNQSQPFDIVEERLWLFNSRTSS
ncbi:hypothetical protein NC652_007177 [Populus alba x Populus x berolinensis]|nr:hypothetical protein NC652_007177 [Populus alba x Populus x berolinensis]